MSDIDTRRAGSRQTVSFATVRVESRHLLPEQLIGLVVESAGSRDDVTVQVEDQGTTGLPVTLPRERAGA